MGLIGPFELGCGLGGSCKWVRWRFGIWEKYAKCGMSVVMHTLIFKKKPTDVRISMILKYEETAL